MNAGARISNTICSPPPSLIPNRSYGMTFRPHLIASLVAASLGAPTLALAADATWAQGSGTFAWATGANWTPTAAPGATSGTTNTDTAVFNNNPGATTGTVTVDANRNLQNIIINQSSNAATSPYSFGGGPFRLTSGGAVTFNSSIATGTIRTIFNSASVILGDTAGGTYSFTSNRISGANIGGLVFNNNATVSGAASTGNTMTLTLNGNSPSSHTSFGNSIRSVVSDGTGGGKLAVTKAGTGTWVLFGDNTYTGATTVNAGTLMLYGSTGSGSAVAVNSGGTLVGGGTINGAATLNSGGHLQAGNLGNTGTSTVGTLTMGSLTSSGGGFLDIEFSSISLYDVYAITGALTLTGTTNVNLFAVATSNPFITQGTYTIMTAASISGFNASSFTVANAQSGLTYNFNNTGTAITLEVVPEPSTYALLGLGLGAVLWRIRRRR